MNQDMDTRNEGGSDTSVTEPKRSSRRLIVGTVVGLVVGLTATGVGLAAQSPLSAKTTVQAPTGAQLPWDDSTSSDDPLARNHSTRNQSNDDANEGADGRAHDRRERRSERRGEMREKMGQHMAGEGLEKPMNRERRDMRERPGMRDFMAGAAETLGISVEDLIAEVRSGKSIADIAKENDVDVQAVIDALVEQVTSNARDMIVDLVERRLPVSQN
jgi:hypothetical protein